MIWHKIASAFIFSFLYSIVRWRTSLVRSSANAWRRNTTVSTYESCENWLMPGTLNNVFLISAVSGRFSGFSNQQSRASWSRTEEMKVSFGIGGRKGGANPSFTESKIPAFKNRVFFQKITRYRIDKKVACTYSALFRCTVRHWSVLQILQWRTVRSWTRSGASGFRTHKRQRVWMTGIPEADVKLQVPCKGISSTLFYVVLF